MWSQDQTYFDRYNDVLIGNQRTCDVDSKITLWRHKRLRKASAIVKMFNCGIFSALSSLKTMFYLSLLLTILMSPSVLSQGEEGSSEPDAAELLGDDNPCKANPCGNGVCLVDKDE